MIDLSVTSGLPIKIGPDNRLKFNQPLPDVEPQARTFEEMKSVLKDPDAKPPFDELYYMYRHVNFKEHQKVIEQAEVSYDITVIPAGKIGDEYNKTVGHYHSVKSGTQFAYPEVYEVLHGKALFLLQKMDPTFEDLITVIAMEASAGEKVVYPPNYGHIIVNIGDEVLVTSNWVGEKFERMYKPVNDRHGMSYYVIDDGKGGYKMVPNKHYGKHPAVRIIDNKFMHRFEIMGSHKPMYLTGVNNPKSLEFLNFPEKYAVELSSITS
ncbi:MAG TPA: glucose-6-phosphate isomerase family protein [Candidatus Binatia bacterium]|nr:glucose-6-phosphate isomerase family protein [Candidatus Binatia bacterium]